MPQISIIVPVYKVENYIHRCIDSILAQTFTDFELILVDDGSPDNCPTICDEYAAKDSRVHVIHQENGGVSAARNAGLKIAVGEYIMFCDSDDYVDSRWCEVMFAAISEKPDVFAVSDIWRENELNKLKSRSGVLSSKSVTYYDIYKLGLSAYTVNKIYNREIVQNNQLYFDEKCDFSEDVSFNAKYYLFCQGCKYIDTPLYYYMSTDESLMNKYRWDLFEKHLMPFYCRIPLISDADLPEYCDTWLYQFLKLFDNVFDPRCTMGFWKKMRYNQRMIRTPEFTFCLEHASGKKESKLFMRVLRLRNYYLLLLFNKLVSLKSKLTR